MKLTQNQYYGLLVELPRKLPAGSSYFCTDTFNIYVFNEQGSPNIITTGVDEAGDLNINPYRLYANGASLGTEAAPTEMLNVVGGATVSEKIGIGAGTIGVAIDSAAPHLDLIAIDVSNDHSTGISSNVTKENTSGAGFASSVFGARINGIANSAEAVVDIQGTRSQAEHTGTGRVYYISGSTNRAYHTGTGDSSAIAGTFSEGKVGGTGVGAHAYVTGSSTRTFLDNPNATVQYLQGMHLTADLGDGTVSDNMTVILLDADYTGAGTIAGDFEYISIMPDTNLPAVGGEARAIHSQSAFPSTFAGAIGIGSSTLPTNTLDVNGTAYVSGNVGIGTTAPSHKLDVTGTGRFTSTLTCQTLVQTSQRDQKKDIDNITKTKAIAIPFKEYKYKSESGDRKRYGVVVEDIEAHHPY